MTVIRIALIWLLVCNVLFGAFACSSAKTIHPSIDPAKPAFGSVKTGDKVRLHLHNGQRLEIRVQGIDSDSLVSVDGIRYARKDIARLERRSINAVRTTALVAGIVVGAVLVITGTLVGLGSQGL